MPIFFMLLGLDWLLSSVAWELDRERSSRGTGFSDQVDADLAVAGCRALVWRQAELECHAP